MTMPFLPTHKLSARKFPVARLKTFFAAIIALIFVAAINDANAQFTFASDNASASVYSSGSGGWQDGDDGGTGFGGWGFTTGTNTGSFIGNPTNNGINNNVMGSEAFGMFSTSPNGNFANRSRGFDVGMGIGDTFTFDWGINWTPGSSGGSKGFDIKAGGTTLFTVINSGTSDAVVFDNKVNSTSGNAATTFGTNNMAVTITRTATGYTFTMTTRASGSLFTTNITTSSTIDNFNFFIGSQQDNNGNRNMYFDNLSITNSGVFSSGGTVTNANTFSGSGALSIGNSTTLILSGGGNNNYTGATTISNGSTLTFAGAGTSTFASTIGGGTGNVIMSNSTGLVLLNSNNTYTGNTTVAAGRLRIGNAGALGSTGTLAVSTGGQLQLSNGITMSRGITLSGDGLSSTGALLNVDGSNIWSGNITNASNTRINADTGTTLTISGNIVNSGGSQNFYIGGAGNLIISGTLDGTATTGNGALYKDGSGVLTLSNNNSGLSGLVRILGGTVRVGSAGNLGAGTVEIGGTGTLSTTSNLTRTAGLTVTDASGGAVVDVASGTAFTQTGAFTGAPTASTKIGKAGAGDLIFNAASGSTFGGQIQIGEGRVIVGTTGALGTNVSTGNRGIDLGLNVGDTSTANNVALLASNGVTVGQSIYVAANNGSAVRTIGLSGNGTNTFSNEIFLAGNPATGNLTLDTGSNAGNLVNLTGQIGGTGGAGLGSLVTVAGSGTLAATSLTSYTDARWSIGSGATLAIGNLRNLGELAGAYYINKVTLSGGTLRLTNSTSLTNVGIQVSANSTISVDSGVTATNPAVMGGTADITKSGAGSLVLTAANTNAGNWTVTEGVLSVSAANNLSTNPASSVTNRLTLNGGTLAVTAGFTANANAGITVGASGGTVDVAANQRLIQGGGLYGGGNLTKTGLGTLSLTNTSGAYAGAITVTNGTLQANSTLRGANISVGNAGTTNGSVLMGSGQVGTVTINTNGRISPGNSVGILSVATNLTLNGGGSYLWEITNTTANTPGVGWDLISVDTTAYTNGQGTLTIGGSGQFTINGLAIEGFSFVGTQNYTNANGYFQIIRAASISGSTNNLALSMSGLGNGSWSIVTNSGGLFLNYDAPGTIWVFTNNVAADQGTANTTTNGNALNELAVITNGASATAVTISNSAAMTFTNPNNSYSGATIIEQGTLVAGVSSLIGQNGAFGASSADVQVGSLSGLNNSNATLLIGAAGVEVSRGVTINSGGTGVRTVGATNATGVATYSGNITMNTNATLSASNSGGTTLFSGAIGGSGAITAAGSGTVTLTGANTYTGSTTVSSNSTLVAANNTALGGGSGATTVSGGGTLAFSNNINEDEAITISGTGVGGLGALRNLSGANTNTGTITLSAVTNLISADAGSLRLGNINNGAVGNQLTFSNATNTTILLTGNLTNMDTSSTFFKTGTGSLVISNAGATVGGAQLQLGGGTVTLAAGAFSTNTATSPRGLDLGLDGGGVASSLNTAFYINSGVTMSNTTFVAAGSGQRIMGTESTSGTATINGEIFLGVGSTLRVSAATNGTALFSGNIVNTGNVTKIGSGVVALSGANTFAGAVDIQAGTLLLSNASGTAMVDTNAVTISNNATLALGTSETVGSISGVTGSSINLNTSQLRAGENDTSTEFAGVMSSSSDAASFVKKGTGTTTFSGVNTMNGQLFLDSGTTRFNVTQGGNFTNLINLGAVGGSASATLSLGASGVTLANPILVRSNTGTTTISALNTTGTATLSGGITLNKDLTIAANSGGNLLITNGALVMSGSGNNDLFITGSNNVTIASVITAPSGASSLNVNGTGVVTLSGDNSANSLMLNLGTVGGTLSVSSLNNLGSPFSYPDKINFNGGTLLVTEDMTIAANTFGMTANSGGGTISVASGKTFTQNSAFTSGNAAGSFNKTGAGTLVLGVTTNQINPTFNIREGTVVVTATGALGGGNAITLGDTSTSGTLRYVGAGFSTGRTNTINAGGGTIDVSNSATLITNTTGMVFNGTFTKAGDGNLILAGTGSGSGKTIISGGTLSISSGGNLGTNPVSVTADAITLAGGTLRANAGMTLGNRGITVGAAGGTISVASGTSLTNTSGLNGTGSLVKDGSGLLHLTNTTTFGNYAGALTVTNGTLQVNTTLRGANISVGHSSSNAGSVLMGEGSVGTVAIGNNGRISPGNSVGILSVSNSLSFNTGGSYLWEISNTNGPAGTDWDLISVDTESVGGGTLNINGAFTIAGTNFNPGSFTFNTQTNYPAFQIVRATTLGGTGSLGDLSFSSLGTSLGASGNWAFSFTNGSGLYATYSAPTASLVFTNDSAKNQGDAGLVTNNNAGDFATITNQGGVTAVVISNTAPVTFTNEANSYTGATTIEQGTLATIVNAGNASGAFGSSNSAAINLGATSGVADATLLIGAAGVTVSKAVDVRGGGSGIRTIGATNASGVATYSGGIALATNVTLSAANSNATTLFSGAISGTAGNVTASGSGVVVLSGANTFSGTTTVSNGATLVAANNAALGNTTGNTVVSSNATLALSNNISTAENISIAGSGVGNSGGALRNLSGNNTNTGTITLSANATIAADSGSTLRLGNINIGTNSRALTFSNEGTILFTGNFANMDTASTFFKNGGGELIISNTSANTGGGQLQQAAGKVTLAAGTFSTNTATGPRGLDFGLTGGGAGSSANTEFYVNGGVTMSNTVYVAGGSGTRTMGTESTAGTATFTGEIYLDNNLTLTAATNGTATFSGSIVNTNGNLTKAGSGTVILSGANTFTGNVDITAGRLNVASGSAIANSAAVTVSNGATLGVTTQEEIGSLAGGGEVSLGTLLIAGGNNASTIYSGEMRNGGGFVKKGTGVMTLSGSSIATGQTFIVNGTLLFAANQGSGFTNIVNLGETSGTDSATLALTNGITLANPLTVRGGSSNNLLTVANLSTSGTTTLSGNVILSNTTTLSSIAGGNVAFTGGTMSFAGSTALNVTNTGNVSIANSISAAGNALIAKRGSGTVTLSATNNAGNVRYDLYGGELQVGSTGAIGNQTGSFLPNKVYFDGGSLGVTGNTTLGGDDGIVLGGGGGTIRVGSGATLTLQGYIQDEARTGLTLSKTGEGTLFLDKGGNNDLGGTTIVVNQGVLSTYNLDLLSPNVQLGAASGATAGTFNFTKTDGAVTAANNFAVNSGGGAISVTDNTLTLSGAISGSGALSKTSAGTLTLSGNNTYSGALTVSGGTLNLNRTGGTSLGSVDSINVASGATLLISQTSQVNSATAEVTLSGGTIRRGGNVSELFGSLNVTTASFLDYGAANAIGTLSFGTYTPSALLTVQNFLPGNVLTFGSNLTGSINNTNLFNLGSQGFTSSWNEGTSTFTITAIPEPSTYLAAAGLLAMFLWPMRRRLIKDTKSILGLRPPARERFGA